MCPVPSFFQRAIHILEEPCVITPRGGGSSTQPLRWRRSISHWVTVALHRGAAAAQLFDVHVHPCNSYHHHHQSQISQPATGPPQATITTYLNPSLRISDCYQLNKPTRTVAHRKGRVETGTARRCKFQDRTHGALGSYFSRMDNRPRAAVKQVGRAHVCIS